MFQSVWKFPKMNNTCARVYSQQLHEKSNFGVFVEHFFAEHFHRTAFGYDVLIQNKQYHKFKKFHKLIFWREWYFW